MKFEVMDRKGLPLIKVLSSIPIEKLSKLISNKKQNYLRVIKKLEPIS